MLFFIKNSSEPSFSILSMLACLISARAIQSIICYSVSLPVCVYVCLLFTRLYVGLSLCPSCLPVFLYGCFPVLSGCVSTCLRSLPVFMRGFLPLCLSACLPVFMSVSRGVGMIFTMIFSQLLLPYTKITHDEQGKHSKVAKSSKVRA
jgi:hypothetical protein